MKKLIRLLMIEDEPLYASLVKRFVSDLVDEIVAVDGLREAENFFSQHFDILWFDLNMPGSTDLEIIAKIAEYRDRNDDSVILVVSGYLNPELIAASNFAGADAVVDKREAATPWEITSMIMMAVMQARKRGAVGNTIVLMERACQLVIERFKIVHAEA